MHQQPNDLWRAIRSFDAKGFVARHGGYKESKSERSHEYLLTCPCGSSRLRWNAIKGTWICWGHPSADWRGRSGDTIALIKIFERCDDDGAIEFLLNNYIGGDSKLERLVGALGTPERGEVRTLPPIPWPRGVERLLGPAPPHERAWSYLAGRGVTAEHVGMYQLGYGRTGRYEGYIVFPCFMGGVLVYYQARATWDPPSHMDEKARKWWVGVTNYRKSLNPTSVAKMATSGEVIFNYDMAGSYESVVICEGPVDAIKSGPNAVALLGKRADAVKLERLKRMRARAYIIYLDRGAEELASARSIAKELSAFADVWIATPPEGHDPGSLSQAQNRVVLASAEKFYAGHI